MLNNNVNTFLLKLSEYYGMDFDLKSNYEFFGKIGAKIGIKSKKRIKGWLLTGYIPAQTIQKILRLDIPDDLKALALRCRRQIIPKLTFKKFFLQKPNRSRSTAAFKFPEVKTPGSCIEKGP